ncbi:MAG: diguanylate cyclase [Desulfobacterales bacterium]
MKTSEQILIVDDDSAIRDSLKEFMEIVGYRCATATSAESALELLKKQKYSVVITDIILPGIDGFEFTEAIKQQYDLDVIIMTGYSAKYSYEEAIGKGASDFVFKPFRSEELLLRLKRVLKERELTDEQNRIMEKLKNLAITDGLTKLYNSRHFYNQLLLEVDRTNRYHRPLSLLLLDIDYFKAYNDNFGHLEGDVVLFRLGQIIKSCLRTMDSAYRYGGEEFTVILPETDGEEASTVAQRIRTAVENEKFISTQGKRSSITISIGVAEYQAKESPKTFIMRSDKAMYEAKTLGRNQVFFISADPSPAHESRMTLEG